MDTYLKTYEDNNNKGLSKNPSQSKISVPEEVLLVLKDLFK